MFGFGYSSLTMNLKIDILKERDNQAHIVAVILLALNYLQYIPDVYSIVKRYGSVLSNIKTGS